MMADNELAKAIKSVIAYGLLDENTVRSLVISKGVDSMYVEWSPTERMDLVVWHHGRKRRFRIKVREVEPCKSVRCVC